MTPIKPDKSNINERMQKMCSEVQAFIDYCKENPDCLAAELWKDESVSTQRNCELYKHALRKSKIGFMIYDICSRKGKVIIKKHGVNV